MAHFCMITCGLHFMCGKIQQEIITSHLFIGYTNSRNHFPSANVSADTNQQPQRGFSLKVGL